MVRHRRFIAFLGEKPPIDFRETTRGAMLQAKADAHRLSPDPAQGSEVDIRVSKPDEYRQLQDRLKALRLQQVESIGDGTYTMQEQPICSLCMRPIEVGFRSVSCTLFVALRQ
jgi:hypothetical protein